MNVDAILDEIADADDADERALADNGKMAEAPLRHARHELAHRILGLAGDDAPRHERVDRHRHEGGAVLGEGMHDVALGEDAGNATPILAHHQGADAARL